MNCNRRRRRGAQSEEDWNTRDSPTLEKASSLICCTIPLSIIIATQLFEQNFILQRNFIRHRQSICSLHSQSINGSYSSSQHYFTTKTNNRAAVYPLSTMTSHLHTGSKRSSLHPDPTRTENRTAEVSFVFSFFRWLRGCSYGIIRSQAKACARLRENWLS